MAMEETPSSPSLELVQRQELKKLPKREAHISSSYEIASSLSLILQNNQMSLISKKIHSPVWLNGMVMKEWYWKKIKWNQTKGNSYLIKTLSSLLNEDAANSGKEHPNATKGLYFYPQMSILHELQPTLIID